MDFELKEFIGLKKFMGDGHAYTGVLDEMERTLFEQQVNDLALTILNLPIKDRTKIHVLVLMKKTLEASTVSDTEDSEAFANYMEDLMDICQIDSSDGLLNNWMYGFNPNAYSPE